VPVLMFVHTGEWRKFYSQKFHKFCTTPDVGRGFKEDAMDMSSNRHGLSGKF